MTYREATMMISNQLTSMRLRRLRDNSRHLSTFSLFASEPIHDTYDLIQKDFMLIKPLSHCIEGSINQTNLQNNYDALVSGNEAFHRIASLQDEVLEMSADVDSGARGLIFGVCIAASMAIKNHTVQSNNMRRVMQLLLHEAMLLQAYYIQRSGTVRIQPSAYNVMLNMIRAVLDNTISTTELIFQANRDCSIELITPPSQVNRIFADLVYFILYKATEYRGSRYDCLATKAPFTTYDRNDICRYLGIHCQTLLIDSDDAALHLLSEGRKDVPPSHTLVIAYQKTCLLLDAAMKHQLRCEKKDRGSFGDPEIIFASAQQVVTPEPRYIVTNAQIQLPPVANNRYSFQHRRQVTFAESVTYYSYFPNG